MPRTIGQPPTVENTMPLALFRAQSPARYSHMDGDKAVLYAGAAGASVHVSSSDALYAPLTSASVSVYVLNTSVILWVPSLHTGLDLPYTSIVLHALKQQEGQVLYMQVMAKEDRAQGDTTELVVALSPAPRETSEAQLPLDSSISELYEALSTCSAFHYDTESEPEEENSWFSADSLPTEPILMPASWSNSGDADDLGMDLPDDSHDEAGMNIAVTHHPVAGVTRTRNGDEPGTKRRR